MNERVTAAGVLFEDERGHVLVLRRGKGVPESGRLGLPGGSVEAGESPSEAAIREVREEIGVAIAPGRLTNVRTYLWYEEHREVTFTVFRVRVVRREMTILLDPRESTAYSWAPPGQLLKRDDLMAGLYPVLRDEYEGVSDDR
jgi:8-oxo-dGTP diphosphatase